MYKITFKIFVAVLLIGNLSIINGQCLTNGITFYDQESIDNFSVNYPGCSIILGDLFIEDASGNITNLNGLSQIVEIQGSLAVSMSHNLLDLSGLDNLNTIGEDLSIAENNNLINLHGLENLESVGSINLHNNDNLVNISNLNITHVENAIGIFSNDNLDSLNGLENITTVNYLLIEENNSLTNLNGLDGLTAITVYSLDILRNDSLLNLSGLDSLTSCEYILISENSSLQNLNGLQSLTSVSGDFYIQINNQLNDLSGLSGLTEVNEIFAILNNDMLLSLNGLEGLTAVNGELAIARNDQLINIDGIRNIDAETITNLYLNNNPNLSDCAVLSVCEHLDIDPGNTFIYDNGPNCQSLQEVEAACALGTEENQLTELKIYPNPTNGTFEISGLKEGTIEIVDSQGRTVKEMSATESSNSISELSSGIYFVKITAEKSSITKQLIKT